MLRCADGSLYTGWTNDLQKRVAAHQSGRGAKYTRSHRPVELAYWEPCSDRQAAMRREAAVKRLTRAEKEKLAAACPQQNLQALEKQEEKQYDSQTDTRG